MSFSSDNGTAVVDESPASEPDTATNSKASRTAKPSRPLPPERLSVAKQFEVLRAFAVASADGTKAATNVDVGKVMGMHPNNACAGNTFMASVGLIIKQADGHMPAIEVLNFNRAHAYSPENASHRVAPVLKASWFGQTVLPLVQLRPRSESEILAELATACSAPSDAKSQLRMLLDYLETVGLVVRENGTIRAAESNMREPVPGTQEKPPVESPIMQPVVLERNPHVVASAPEGGIVFNVNIAVSMKEIGSWPKDRISSFFDGLAKVISAKGEGD